MIRVLHLANSYLPYTGGSSIRMQSVLKPLREYPHIETHVLTNFPPLVAPLAPYEVLDNIHVHRVASQFRLPAKIRSLHKRYHFDVIHAHNPRFALMSILMTSCPLILEFHAINHEMGIKASLTRFACRRAARLFTLADSATKALCEKEKLPPEKVETLYNGVDVDQFQPQQDRGSAVREQYGIGDGVVVGYAGTFWDWQGVPLLVRGFATIAAQYPTARLLLVGDKPELKTIQRLAEALSIRDQVIFTGSVPFQAMVPYFAAMDIFGITRPACISTDTAVPLKVLEAMCMEKCVVATPVGGMVEVIQHGVTGWLTPDFEPATIGNAITRLIADAELRTRIGKAARNFVINRFCWRTTTEKMVRAYEAIATNGAASS